MRITRPSAHAEGRRAVEATVRRRHGSSSRTSRRRTTARATLVDAFGGWVGAAWLIASEDPPGLGAEPCPAGGGDGAGSRSIPGRRKATSPSLSSRIPSPSTRSSTSPCTPRTDRRPVRTPWTDLRDRAAPQRGAAREPRSRGRGGAPGRRGGAGRPRRRRLGRHAEGRRASAARSPPRRRRPRLELPVAGGAGPTTLSIGVPTEAEARFEATLLSREPPQDAGGLSDGEHPGPPPHAYPRLHRGGPSGVALERARRGHGGGSAPRRRLGSIDAGATAGGSTSASAWLVPSTVLADPSFPAVVLVNPGSRDASVTLAHLPGGDAERRGTRSGSPSRPELPSPCRRRSCAAAPDAAILVAVRGCRDRGARRVRPRCGIQGYARYALVLGVPLPERA